MYVPSCVVGAVDGEMSKQTYFLVGWRGGVELRGSYKEMRLCYELCCIRLLRSFDVFVIAFNVETVCHSGGWMNMNNIG